MEAGGGPAVEKERGPNSCDQKGATSQRAFRACRRTHEHNHRYEHDLMANRRRFAVTCTSADAAGGDVASKSVQLPPSAPLHDRRARMRTHAPARPPVGAHNALRRAHPQHEVQQLRVVFQKDLFVRILCQDQLQSLVDDQLLVFCGALRSERLRYRAGGGGGGLAQGLGI